MSGQFDLGLAEGKVRIVYESTGQEKALAQMQAFQESTVKSADKWLKWGKEIDLHSESLRNLEKLQKAYNSAVKVAVATEATLAKTRRDSKAGFKDAFNASRDATLAQKSVQDLAKVLSRANKQVTTDMAKEGSKAAQAFTASFDRAGQSGARAASHKIAGSLSAGLGMAAKGAMSAVAGAALTAGAAAGVVLAKGISRSVQLDTVQHKLAATGRSAAQVKAIMSEVKEAAKGTEYSLGEMGEVASSALNAGIQPGQELGKYLKLVADTASATGRPLGDIASLLNGINTNQRASLIDIRSLADSGIDIWSKLGEVLGVSQSKLQDMVSNNQVSAKAIQAALQASVGGMSAEMSKSVAVLSKNIMNSIARIGEAFISPAFGEAGGLLDNILNALKGVEEWMSQHKEGIIDFWADLGQVAMACAHVVLDAVSFLSDAVVKITEVIGDVSGWAVQLWGQLNKLVGRNEVAKDLEKTAQSLHNLGTGLRQNRDANLSAMFNALDRGGKSLEKWRNNAKAAANADNALGTETETTKPKIVSLTDALDKMGIKYEDVSKSIEGTTEQFHELLKNLKDKGATSSLLNTVTQLRDRFVNGGEAVRGFAKAINSLADSTEDAGSKSQQLIKYLQRLNVIPDDSAIDKYNEAFRKTTELQPDLVNQLEATGSALVNLDGTFNTTSENGKNLRENFDSLRDAAIELASSGKADFGQVWENTAAGMRLTLQQFGIVGDEAEKVIAQRLMPKDMFVKMFESAGDPQSALNAVIKDPVKLKTALDLAANTTDDILKQITGPDGSFHVPTVLDVKPPEQPAAPDTPANLPPVTNPDGTTKSPSQIAMDRLNAQYGYDPSNPKLGNIKVGSDGRPDFGSSPDKALAKKIETLLHNYKAHDEGDGSVKSLWPAAAGSDQHAYAQRTLTDKDLGNLKNTAVVEEALRQSTDAQQALGKTYAQYKAQGKTLADAYAEGILSGDEDVRKAIIKIAQIAGDGLGNSPAKYGPLSGSGWTLNRGKKFTVAFAEGIGSQVDSVKESSTQVAGGAVAPLSESFEKWIKDMNEFSSFGKGLKDFASSISDIFMQVAQIGQTLSGGRLFPKNYVKDPAMAQKAQQKALRDNMLRSQGINPDNLFGAQGNRSTGAGMFSGANVNAGDLSGAKGIAQYIYAKARAAGFSHEMANDFVIQAAGESGFNPKANGGNQDGTGDVGGVFQFTPGTWKSFGNGGNMFDAKDNIDAYFRLVAARGPDITDPVQIGTKISIGGPWHPQNQAKGHLTNAKNVAAPYLIPDSEANTPPNLTPPPSNAVPAQQPQEQPKQQVQPPKDVAAQQPKPPVQQPAQPKKNEKAKPETPPESLYTIPMYYGKPWTKARDGLMPEWDENFGWRTPMGGGMLLEKLSDGTFIYANPKTYKVPSSQNETKPIVITPDKNDSIFGPEYSGSGAQLIPMPKGDPNELPLPVRSADQYGGVAKRDHETPLNPQDDPKKNPERITPQQVSTPQQPTVLPRPNDQQPQGNRWTLNQNSRANIPLGGSTTSAVARAGIPRLYNGTDIPPEILQMAKDFGLTVSTYGDGGSLHQAGFAFDFGGTPENMDAFAEYVSKNLMGQTLELIHSNDKTGKRWGIAGGKSVDQPGDAYQNYFGNEYGNHDDYGPNAHVHWATDVLPTLNGNIPLRLDASGNLPTTLNGVSSLASTQFGLPGLLDQMAASDERLGNIMRGARSGFGSDDEAIAALRDLDNRIADQNNLNTPQSKQMATELGNIRTGIMNSRGLTEGPDTLSNVTQIASGATGLVGDVFDVIDNTLNSIAGAKQISGTLVRGIENTKDINDMIDSFQNFLALAQSIGQTITDGLGMASMITGMAGEGDTSGGAQGAAAALGAASSIAGVVTSVIGAINSGIDLAQEAYALGTKYLGRMLVNLFGMPNATDIKYLLDTVTGELKIYSSDNPDYKTTFNTLDRQIFGTSGDRTQPSNTFHIYQGPGQDPRDTMNDAMFAIRSSGTGVFGYDS